MGQSRGERHERSFPRPFMEVVQKCLNQIKKVCSVCKEPRLLIEFWKHRGSTDGLASACIPCERLRRARYRALPENVEKYRKSSRDWWSNLKTEVMSGYGNICACCGETEPKFLTLDHVIPCGSEQRKAMGGTQGTYKDARDRGFPPDYQLLCGNCNFAKGYYGICPHKATLGESEPESEFYKNGRVVRRPPAEGDSIPCLLEYLVSIPTVLCI